MKERNLTNRTVCGYGNGGYGNGGNGYYSHPWDFFNNFFGYGG